MNSVTKVLDSYIEPEIWEWKIRVGKAKAKKVSDEALAIGSEVDRLIQEDINGNGESIESKAEGVQNAYNAWLSFKQKYPFFVQDIEGIQVELIDGEIVGHPDIKKLEEISDVKTSSFLTIRPKWVVQASKYALMSNKNRASILLLSKQMPSFLYVWWDGELLQYFGGKVFDAFETILEYQGVAKDMIRNYMEREVLDVS